MSASFAYECRAPPHRVATAQFASNPRKPFPRTNLHVLAAKKKSSLQAGKCSRIPRVFPAVPGVFPVVPGVFPAVSRVVPGVFPYLLLGMFQVLARQAIKTFEDFHATRTKSHQPIFQMLQIHNRQTSRFLYQSAKLSLFVT